LTGILALAASGACADAPVHESPVDMPQLNEGLGLLWSWAFFAQKMRLKDDDLKKDWPDAVFPGIQNVPSGVVACTGAESRGCASVFAG